MISKTFLTGKTFGESVLYVCQDQERAQILEVEGVRKHDLHLMTQDFETQQALANQRKEKPVYHNVLSYQHGENPGDERLVEIGKRFMQEIRMADTQYIIVKHTDKEHLHVHILANRVSNDGSIVGEGLVIERGIAAARKLTQEYGLRQEQGKNLQQTNREALHEPDVRRYRLYEVIKEVLPGCRQMDEFEKRLLERGISTRYRIDRESGVRQGISFRIENYCFKGSEVDRAYSIKGLERTLALQQKQALEEAQVLEETMQRKQVPEQTEMQRQAQAARERKAMKQELRQGPRLHL